MVEAVRKAVEARKKGREWKARALSCEAVRVMKNEMQAGRGNVEWKRCARGGAPARAAAEEDEADDEERGGGADEE